REFRQHDATNRLTKIPQGCATFVPRVAPSGLISDLRDGNPGTTELHQKKNGFVPLQPPTPPTPPETAQAETGRPRKRGQEPFLRSTLRAVPGRKRGQEPFLRSTLRAVPGKGS